jgi:hypothetical protein
LFSSSGVSLISLFMRHTDSPRRFCFGRCYLYSDFDFDFDFGVDFLIFVPHSLIYSVSQTCRQTCRIQRRRVGTKDNGLGTVPVQLEFELLDARRSGARGTCHSG